MGPLFQETLLRTLPRALMFFLCVLTMSTQVVFVGGIVQLPTPAKAVIQSCRG